MHNESIPVDPARDPLALGASGTSGTSGTSGAPGDNAARFAPPPGRDLLRRSSALDAWVALRMRRGVWPSARVPDGAPGPLALGKH